jgi:para-aminobenzoate synthetase component 1
MLAGAGEAEVLTLAKIRDPFDLFRTLSRDTLPVILQSGRNGNPAGRYSIVASEPFMVLGFRQGRGSVRSRIREEVFEGDPLPVLQRELDRHRVPRNERIPFLGGAIGYLGYGLSPWIGGSRRPASRPSRWPDLHLAFYDHAFVVDHAAGKTHLVVTGWPEEGPSRRRQKRRMDLLAMQECFESRAERVESRPEARMGRAEFVTSKEQYLRDIRRAQELLAAGEIYQVNLSHKIRLPGDWNPPDLYRRLLERHPSSFAAYLPLRDHALLCASPERLVRLSGRRAETSPIKGTRARSPVPEADREVSRALAMAPKERAENVMIVDLARNDLGRVCVPGTVITEELCRVETLPSVHHLVSTVAGSLREEACATDLVRALFPGGSMTGAPKIRAMEIIDELERFPRGIYSGSVGYFSLGGDLDLNIVIRSLIVSEREAELQVGGAILAESDPEAESRETLDKARPLLELLDESEIAQEETRRGGA